MGCGGFGGLIFRDEVFEAGYGAIVTFLTRRAGTMSTALEEGLDVGGGATGL